MMGKIKQVFLGLCIVLVFSLGFCLGKYHHRIRAFFTSKQIIVKSYNVDDIYNYLITGRKNLPTHIIIQDDSISQKRVKTINDIMNLFPSDIDSLIASEHNVLEGKLFWSLDTTNWGLKEGKLLNNWLVPKTGQTRCKIYRDDGHLKYGSSKIMKPNYGINGAFNPLLYRFSDNNDGTITDNLTQLIWTKNAQISRTKTWREALEFCDKFARKYNNTNNPLNINDWRLPNINELYSLCDPGRDAPTLPLTHPFNIEVTTYLAFWSSSTISGNDNQIWALDLHTGIVFNAEKDNFDRYGLYIWPVKGGYNFVEK